MAVKRKLELFTNEHHYEENAALQNHCTFNTITGVAFRNAHKMADLSINYEYGNQQDLRDCSVIDSQ